MIKFIEEFFTSETISPNGFEQRKKNLATDRMFQMYVNNTVGPEGISPALDETMLAKASLWKAFFKEQNINDEKSISLVIQAVKLHKKHIKDTPDPKIHLIRDFQSRLIESVLLQRREDISFFAGLGSSLLTSEERTISELVCKRPQLMTSENFVKVQRMLGLSAYAQPNRSLITFSGPHSHPSAEAFHSAHPNLELKSDNSRRGLSLPSFPEPGPFAVAGAFDPGGAFGGAAAAEGLVGCICLYIGGIFCLVNCITGQLTEVSAVQNRALPESNIDRNYAEAIENLKKIEPQLKFEAKNVESLSSILAQIKDELLPLGDEPALRISELIKNMVGNWAGLEEQQRTEQEMRRLGENCKKDITAVIVDVSDNNELAKDHALKIQKRIHILVDLIIILVIGICAFTAAPATAMVVGGVGAVGMLGMFGMTYMEKEKIQANTEVQRTQIDLVKNKINQLPDAISRCFSK